MIKPHPDHHEEQWIWPVEAFWSVGDYFQILEDANSTGGRYGIIRHILARAGPDGVPLHFHRRTSETITVEKGPVGIYINGELFHRDAGESVEIPAGAAHRVIGEPLVIASVIVRFEPAGVEGLIRALGRRHDTPRDPLGVDPVAERDRFIRIGAEYDLFAVEAS